MHHAKTSVVAGVLLMTFLLSWAFPADTETPLQLPQTEPALFAQIQNMVAKQPDQGATPEEGATNVKNHLARIDELCRDYLAKYPEGPNALTVRSYQVQAAFFAANLAADKAAVERVVQDIEKLLTDHPGVPVIDRLHATLAQYFMETDQLDKAAQHLLLFAKSTTDERAARTSWVILSQVQSQSGNFEAAGSTLKNVIEKYPDSQEADYAKKTLKRLDTIGKPMNLSYTSVDGRQINLADFRGKVVLVDCWASWCLPCRAEVPGLVELFRARQKDGFEIVGISFDTDKQEMLDFEKGTGMTWPESFDPKGWKGDLAQSLGIMGIPASYLLDRNGVVRALDLRGSRLVQRADQLLKEPVSAPAAPTTAPVPAVPTPPPPQ